MSKPYCRFNHGRMLKTRGKFSKRDGGKRQYYHCRCPDCGYTALLSRDDDAYFRDRFPENWEIGLSHMADIKQDWREAGVFISL